MTSVVSDFPPFVFNGNNVFKGKIRTLPFRRFDPEYISPSKPFLEEHLIWEHFSDDYMKFYGVPDYDIDLAAYNGFKLNDFARFAYLGLKDGEVELKEISSRLPDERYLFDTSTKVKILAKSIVYAHKRGVVDIDLNDFEELYEGITNIDTDYNPTHVNLGFYLLPKFWK